MSRELDTTAWLADACPVRASRTSSRSPAQEDDPAGLGSALAAIGTVRFATQGFFAGPKLIALAGWPLFDNTVKVIRQRVR